ncbi:50S ribosomal protein L29 [Candidatus Rhabdochlamydia porcellionis]|jgi:large subunit ribosomal protein L29|uniref:Large ribosomal subunit protein uL29 n=1 Tax=Candidatus Rhabdochlamydia porcellionis TaxID=225148 RepID=A0ABX8Z2H2_9BACT|nr:50S ribosomal protein L29 [Candidatus Rhabdochlamydia porcellionis]QZA58312.1 Ribosomal L29 protein [Candidatus Rhabdochlamydia porcellionis]
MPKAKELRDQSREELQALYADLSKEIFELRNELKTTRKLEKPHLIRLKKRDKARVLTILQEKKA